MKMNKRALDFKFNFDASPFGNNPWFGEGMKLTPETIKDFLFFMDEWREFIKDQTPNGFDDYPDNFRALVIEIQTLLEAIYNNLYEPISKERPILQAAAAASFAFLLGRCIERVRLMEYESDTISGLKSHAAAKKKGRKARDGSIRSVLDANFPDWRTQKVGWLATQLKNRYFPKSDIENLRIYVTKARRIPAAKP